MSYGTTDQLSYIHRHRELSYGLKYFVNLTKKFIIIQSLKMKLVTSDIRISLDPS